jgi:fatty acid desaturase
VIVDSPDKETARLRRVFERNAALHYIDNRVFIRKLSEQAALFAIGAALLLLPLFHGIWIARLAGLSCLGVTYARNLELMHECLHGTALRSRRMNRVIGTLLGLPMFVSFTEWRSSHAQHHRDVRLEGFQYRLERLRGMRELLLHLTMARHFGVALANMLESLVRNPKRLDSAIAGSVRREHLMMLALSIGVLTAAFAGNVSPLLLWFASLPIAVLVHVHIELPEHLECDTDSRNALHNARIIRAGRFAAWFTNNNHLHAVHHWLASVPIANLPQLANAVQAHTLHVEESYPAFFRRFYQRVFR